MRGFLHHVLVGCSTCERVAYVSGGACIGAKCSGLSRTCFGHFLRNYVKLPMSHLTLLLFLFPLFFLSPDGDSSALAVYFTHSLSVYIIREPFQQEAARECFRFSSLSLSVPVCGVICSLLFLILFGAIAWYYV